MSRCAPASGGPEGSTAIGVTIGRAGRPAARRSSAPSLTGQQQRRARQHRALARALPDPVAPGAVLRASASKRIAPGSGASSAAVIVE